MALAIESDKVMFEIYREPEFGRRYRVVYFTELDEHNREIEINEAMRGQHVFDGYLRNYSKQEGKRMVAGILERLNSGQSVSPAELERIIARVRSHGILARMITNGYLLTRERIERLNRAGLEHLQISIDNAMPDETSKKSLKVLDQKLVLLSEYAEFQVNINSVLGCGIRFPEDALKVARRALELGFTSTIGVLHDGNGQLKPLSGKEQEIFEEVMILGKRSYSRFNQFQHNIARGKANEWRCRSGARYLYICEDGLVHWCSQQRGYPGIPLRKYTLEDFRREFNTAKPCAPHCTVSCSQQVAMLDNWRAPQTLRPNPAGVPAAQGLVQLTGARASEHD